DDPAGSPADVSRPGVPTMDEHSIVTALNATWFGAGLPPETQVRLAGLARVDQRPSGIELFHEGELNDEFSVILKGRVALRLLVPERGMVTILTVDPGDILGWSSIVPPHRATSTAVTIEPIEALVFDGADLRALLRSDHALAASIYPRILQAVSRRLTATRMQLLDLFARETVSVADLRSW
ncbi:MAG TPA: cyclic nucleotide-binding domain-containing protein, partial [Candidatus Limnocylindrales bacterium]